MGSRDNVLTNPQSSFCPNKVAFSWTEEVLLYLENVEDDQRQSRSLPHQEEPVNGEPDGEKEERDAEGKERSRGRREQT